MNSSILKAVSTSQVSTPQTVAIIGGGFSGSMVATHLLSAGIPLTVKLIEKRPEAGQGIAYSTSVDAHLLNVPVGKMSAFPDQPEHFLKWIHKTQPHGIAVDASAFVSRRLYGDYIQTTLREAIIHAAPFVRFERITEEAVGIEPSANGALIHLSTGESLYANKVVLATGNFPAGLPAPLNYLSQKPYLRNAWSWNAVAQLNPDAAVLLVGTGLTMADMVISLYQQRHRGPIYAVSRHGLLPQRHQPTVARSACVDLEHGPATIRGLFQQIRQEIKAAACNGQDWRSVVDGLRPITQSLWQKLPLTEQQRFLRHVKSYWEVHRHRIAPEVANVLDQLIQSGQLIHYAGRIQSCQPLNQPEHGPEHGINITLRLRGTSQTITFTVDRIINCTGADCDYRRIQHPLFASLQEHRLIRPSALAIGIDTDANGAVIDADGNASSYLYTLGTARKASLWETTAVPELRVQAQDLAKEILQSLAGSIPVALPNSVSEFNQLAQPMWTFRQLFDRESCTYTYLIADTHSAILVDPVLEQVERDLQVLRELGLSLYACLETHLHADHITGAHRLRILTGCQVIVPNHIAIQGADRFIQDGEILQMGAVKILAMATPGHTDSHMAYLVNGTHLLTGDALFIRGCGRTDFQAGDAGSLFDAVTQKLFTLPDSTLVYPGHDYQGRTCSTIGEEKRWNPRFAGRSRSQFIQLMNSLNLPFPQKMKVAVPANERCGEVLQPLSVDVDASTPGIPAFYGMYI
ncbi:MAG: FAD/NAD(P)-binding protein [Elainella sp. C42_A2020_010]|nr:FAD/NAD(P)-binding protein [Elainella sp. C42_A2020_010]